MVANRSFRSRVVRSSGRPRRGTIWIASADVTAKIGLAAATSVLDQSVSAATLSSFGAAAGTVTRTRGDLWVVSDQTVATEEPFGALGMAVVSDQARAAGIASMPTPITNEDSDLFFVHQFWQAGFVFNQIDATGVQLGNYWSHYSFDSKAMRKLNDDQAIVVTMENAEATNGVRYILKFRMLIKLN